MALRTERGREPCRNVVRNSAAKGRRAVPSRLVAPVAIRVRRGEGIVVADVGIGAGYHFAGRRQLVRARQRPTSRGVIEDCRSPSNSVVAGGAISRGKWRSST